MFHVRTKLQKEKIQTLEQLPQSIICHAEDEQLNETLLNWLLNCHRVIIVAGLGGKTVQQLLPSVLHTAIHEQKAPILIYSLPARFEGIKRAITAEKTFAELPRKVTLVQIENELQQDMVYYYKQMDAMFYEQIVLNLQDAHEPIK